MLITQIRILPPLRGFPILASAASLPNLSRNAEKNLFKPHNKLRRLGDSHYFAAVTVS